MTPGKTIPLTSTPPGIKAICWRSHPNLFQCPDCTYLYDGRQFTNIKEPVCTTK